MTLTLQEAYARLKEHFGTHRDAAEYLKMTEQHYNALRNGRANIPSWREEQIISKAEALESVTPSSQEPQPKAQARP